MRAGLKLNHSQLQCTQHNCRVSTAPQSQQHIQHLNDTTHISQPWGHSSTTSPSSEQLNVPTHLLSHQTALMTTRQHPPRCCYQSRWWFSTRDHPMYRAVLIYCWWLTVQLCSTSDTHHSNLLNLQPNRRNAKPSVHKQQSCSIPFQYQNYLLHSWLQFSLSSSWEKKPTTLLEITWWEYEHLQSELPICY